MNGPCSNCGESTEYRPKNGGRSRDGKCKKCRTKMRLNARLKKMGLTSEQHAQDLKDANGICPVCGRPAPILNRDHCHASGKARGLLCTRCNLILGHAEDDVDILYSLADYLEEYEDLHYPINDSA